MQNNCQTMKWLCRYNGEEHALWKEVIEVKFGVTNPWWTKIVTEP